jgi:ADP-ribose pyrophosphatase YjhB (NUDIX family)
MSYIKKLRQKIGNELLQVPSVAGLIRNSENQLLFIRKSEDGVWGLPAGAIEPGETPKEAVVREVFEETGLKVNLNKIVGVFGGANFRHTYPSGDQVEYLITLFTCEILEVSVATDNEISEMKYFSQAEMPNIAIPYPVEVLYGTGSECLGN